jgi:hypothetical protein
MTVPEEDDIRCGVDEGERVEVRRSGIGGCDDLYQKIRQSRLWSVDSVR